MSLTKTLGKTIVISLVLVFVLSAVILPTTSAGYGELRKFLRNPPTGLSQAKLWDVYMNSAYDPPGRIISVFTIVGVIGGNPDNHNILDGSKSIIVGIIGISTDPELVTTKDEARFVWENFEIHTYLDGDEIIMEKTPMHKVKFTDPETGEKITYWDWRLGVTYKKGELQAMLGSGIHTFRQVIIDEYGFIVFDTDWFGGCTFEFW
jgi:hypothetical protein